MLEDNNSISTVSLSSSPTGSSSSSHELISHESSTLSTVSVVTDHSSPQSVTLRRDVAQLESMGLTSESLFQLAIHAIRHNQIKWLDILLGQGGKARNEVLTKFFIDHHLEKSIVGLIVVNKILGYLQSCSDILNTVRSLSNRNKITSTLSAMALLRDNLFDVIEGELELTIGERLNISPEKNPEVWAVCLTEAKRFFEEEISNIPVYTLDSLQHSQASVPVVGSFKGGDLESWQQTVLEKMHEIKMLTDHCNKLADQLGDEQSKAQMPFAELKQKLDRDYERKAQIFAKLNEDELCIIPEGWQKDPESIDSICNANIDLLTKDAHGLTLLHHAVEHRQKEVIRYLLDRAESLGYIPLDLIKATNHQGQDAVDLAISVLNRQIFEILISYLEKEKALEKQNAFVSEMYPYLKMKNKVIGNARSEERAILAYQTGEKTELVKLMLDAIKPLEKRLDKIEQQRKNFILQAQIHFIIKEQLEAFYKELDESFKSLSKKSASCSERALSELVTTNLQKAKSTIAHQLDGEYKQYHTGEDKAVQSAEQAFHAANKLIQDVCQGYEDYLHAWQLKIQRHIDPDTKLIYREQYRAVLDKLSDMICQVAYRETNCGNAANALTGLQAKLSDKLERNRQSSRRNGHQASIGQSFLSPIDYVDGQGNTILDYALESEDMEFAYYLIKEGMNLFNQNREGKLPIHYFDTTEKIRKHKEIVLMILDGMEEQLKEVLVLMQPIDADMQREKEHMKQMLEGIISYRESLEKKLTEKNWKSWLGGVFKKDRLSDYARCCQAIYRGAEKEDARIALDQLAKVHKDIKKGRLGGSKLNQRLEENIRAHGTELYSSEHYEAVVNRTHQRSSTQWVEDFKNNDAVSAALQNLRSLNEGLRHEVDRLKTDLTKAEQDAREKKDELADAKAEIKQVKKDLADAKEEVKEKKGELREAKGELNEAKSELRLKKREVEEMKEREASFKTQIDSLQRQLLLLTHASNQVVQKDQLTEEESHSSVRLAGLFKDTILPPTGSSSAHYATNPGHRV